MLDGAEVAHPMMEQGERQRRELLTFYERGRQLNPHLAAIGSSDVHMTPTFAVCRTLLFVHDASAVGVLDAIRKGRTVAVDPHGHLHGPPELVRLIEKSQPTARIDARPRVRRTSLGMALFGGLGLLLLGARRHATN
jgi:hypothetical protein